MVRSRGSLERLGSEKNAGKAKANGAIFLMAALDMSWRLAIAILVPIIGGFELDQHVGTTPALTIVGFLLAMAGLFLILKHTLATADDKFKPTETRR